MITASASSKALPLSCLIAVFSTSLALFLIQDQRYVDHLPGLVEAHRNVFQVVVQIVSTMLSIAQMLVVCSLINFAVRIKLFESSTSTGELSFWSALSIPRFDTSLPWVELVLVALVLVLGPGLGALWSGSLTPLSSTTSKNDGHVLIPVFNAHINLTMYPRSNDGAIITQCAPPLPDPRGPPYPSLDKCIVLNKVGSLLMSASTATNVTSPRLHPKIDNSTWTYRGRSYGKGSSTGLFEVNGTADVKTADQGFSYEETGYRTTASCRKQSSVIFPFTQYYGADVGTQFNLSSANTVILESGNVSIPPFDVANAVWNGFNSQAFGFFAWTSGTDNGVNYVATSSNDWSSILSDILCTIEFTPMLFLTNVSTVDQFITVTPLREIDNFNQTGDIIDAIMADLDLMSRMSSSSLTFSPLYHAITTNWQSVKRNNPNASDGTISELSMQDAIIEIADDLLNYQGILAVARADGESVAQPVQRHFAAIKIGQARFHIAQLTINIVLCLVYIYEASRTRYWKRLPDFNFVNPKALTLAALGPEEQTKGNVDTSPLLPSSSFSHRRAEKDTTRLAAFYDENSRLRIRYAVSVEQLQHELNDINISRRTTSADEALLHPREDHGEPSRNS